jgi:tetratricopeptide (TPR) repeat protein
MSGACADPTAGAVELARVHLAQSRPDRALEALARIDPETGDYWVIRATALHNLERYEEAATAASEGLKWSQSMPLLLVLASAWTETDRLADAERVILSALAMEPENALCLTSYARMLATGGQLEKAAAVAAEAVRHAPGDAHVQCTRALTLWMISDDRHAEHVLRRVLAEAPEDQGALSLLAAIESERGDHHTSYARVRRILARDPARIGHYRKALPESAAAAHPLLTPVRPLMTWNGPAVLWLVVAALLVVGVVFRSAWFVFGLGLLYLAYAVYGHVVFRWLQFRSRRRFS